jgi:hypothetical protein
MNARKRLLTLVAVLFVVTMGFAENPHLGTWKLNEAKSKIHPGAAKNLMVSYEAMGDNIKCTLDGVDSKGNPTHSEWTGKFDGKEYPVTGDPTSDMRSYKMTGTRSMVATATKDGKVTLTADIAISADGKTRSLTSHTTDSAGKKVTSMGFYDKQ